MDLVVDGMTRFYYDLIGMHAMITDILFDKVLLIAFAIIFVVLRFLRCFSEPKPPRVDIAPNAIKMHRIVKICEDFHKVFRPPRIWGRNGHFQTIFYGVLGHALLRRQYNKRHCVTLPDKSTVTFDVYEPTETHSSGRDYTLCLCPGIANSSESNYIRTAVHYAQDRGYRCAILNHLGALRNVRLTSARIFAYGKTEELECMLREVCKTYRQTRLICVGFSMGGNLTTKLMAEMDDTLRSRIVAALSVCQPYDARSAIVLYHDWECGRRLYNYVITENMKQVLRRNYKQAVRPFVENGVVDAERMWASTSIAGIDEYYNRRVHGFDSVDDYYRSCSSIYNIPDVKVPIVYLNSYDDPIVPPPLWEAARARIMTSHSEQAFVLTKHGGHLGFLEGHSLNPSSTTWLDRFIVSLSDAYVQVLDDDIK